MHAETPAMTSTAGPDEAGSAARPQPRFLVPLLLSNLALFSTYLGVGVVFLPTQISAIDDDPVAKAANLSVVMGVAALVGLVAQPLFGALSDRSRRRNPWILGFGIAVSATAVWVSFASTLGLLLLLWCLVTVLLNGYQANVTAVVPDRVPPPHRGLASAFVGAATPIAAVVGVGSASALVGHLTAGYAAFGVLVALSAILFVSLNREPEPLPRTRETTAAQLTTLLSAFRHRDFLLAFVSRACVMLAYLIVFGYLLFLLESRVQLPHGWTPVAGLTTLTVIAATAMVIGTVAGGMLADKLRRYRVFVVIGAALIAVAALPPLLVADLPTMAAYAALMGLGFGCFLAVDTAIVTLVLPSADDAARDLGILNIANTVPQTLAAFLAGLIVSALGGGPDAYGALFVVSIGFAVIGGAVILGIKGLR